MKVAVVTGLAVSCLLCLAVLSESPKPAGTPQPSPASVCTSREFRQFDFWLGKWKVKNPDGNQVGTSEVTRVSEGCAIHENWKSGRGTTGMSINYYDPSDRQWHQHWVGGDGTILHLHGELVDKAMVLTGDTEASNGAKVDRITWTPLRDGKVKQEWSTSTDDSKTWQTSFTGLYEKL